MSAVATETKPNETDSIRIVYECFTDSIRTLYEYYSYTRIDDLLADANVTDAVSGAIYMAMQ